MALGACDPQIDDLSCPGIEADPILATPFAAPGAVTFARAGPFDASGRDAQARAALAASIAETIALKARAAERQGDALVFRAPARSRVALNVLAMSTGGQVGAFSSGFLTGWSGNGRPSFDVVTGASAGGMIAPVAFAGTDFDAKLRLNSGFDEEEVLRQRSLFELIGASALYETDKLRGEVNAAIDPPLISAISDRHADGAVLLVSAVNLETTRLVPFDLGKLATDIEAGELPTDCMVEAVMASSAIPVMFPPRRINGQLHADSGLRSHILLQAIADGIALERRRSGIRTDVNLTLLINGDLAPPEGELETHLLDIAERTFSTVIDEGLRQSVLEALDLAQGAGWRVRGALAEDLARILAMCDPANTGREPKSVFNACVTRELHRHGVEVATASPIAWKSAADLRHLALKGPDQ